MNYKIYIGDSICERCGKKHKKIFEIDDKKYGGSCAKEILGKNLNAPIWLYELAEKVLSTDEMIKELDETVNDEDTDISNFEMSFWFELSQMTDCDFSSFEGSKLFNKSFKINGKNVKVDWQYEITDYVKDRYLNHKQ